MAATPYNTSSIGWELRQLARRFGQWAEYQANQTEFPELPDWELPDWLQWDFPDAVGQTLFWLVITGLTLWLAWLLYLSLEPLVSEWLARDQKWARFGRKRVEQAVEHSPNQWMQQALDLAKSGKYREACVALYQATLQQLHERDVLRHLPSRTDGEYLQGLAQHLPPEQAAADNGLSVPRPYQLLIGTHERLTFGQAIASAEIFKRCRRAYEEIAKK